MRMFIASFRIATLLMIFAPPMYVGCSGGNGEPEVLTKDSDPPDEGMVWNDQGEYWEYANTGGGGGDGYGGGYDYESGYEDPAPDDDSVDEGNDDSDDVAQQDNGDGYGNGADPYANSGGSDGVDPYAKPSDSSGADAYASAANSDGGYGQPAGGGGGGGGSGVYAEKIEPLLRAHCYNCHGGGERGKKGGFSLHTPAAIQAEGTQLIKPREPDDSELYLRISIGPGEDLRMPPKGPGLSPEEVALVKDWIQSGADFGTGGGNQGGGYGDGYGDGYANSGGGRGRGDRGGQDEDPYDDDERDEPEDRGPVRPKNLAEASSVTFQRGNDLEAMNQLYAQTLVRNSDVATTVLEKYRYVPALRRARLAVRWGVGVVYKPVYDYGGSPRAPGVHQDLDLDDDADEESDEYADLRFKNEGLDYYTGDIGDEILLRLESRIERSFYGEILKEELEKRLSGGDEDDDYGDGGYGSSDDGGYGRGGGSRGGGYGGGGDSSSEKPDDDKIEQVMPGVIMLGQAKSSKLLERAKEQGLDLLVVVDIKTTPDNRRRIADSTFRVRLYDVATKAQLATTGRIRNLDVQKKRAKDPDDESIIKEIDKIFLVADEGARIKDKTIRPYKVTEFPSGTSDKVKKGTRGIVARLLLEPKENPLAELSEVRFYESRGLLTSPAVAKAFEKLTPEHAAMLTKVVDENELRTTLTDWLVVDEPVGDDDEEDDAPRRRPRRGFR